MLREWPRGQRTKQNKKQVVCEVHFLLEEAEKEQLIKICGKTLNSNYVVVTKDYEGNFEINVPDQVNLFPEALHPNEIDQACEKLPEPHESVGELFAKTAIECLEETKRYAREGRYTDLPELGSRHGERLQASLTPGNPDPQHSNEKQFNQTYTQAIKQLKIGLGEARTIHQQAHEFIVNRIPTFIYMDDYKSFRGRADLSAVKEKRDNQKVSLTEEDETFRMILNLAGLDLDKLIKQGDSVNQDTLHERQLDCQDAAVTLTNEVANRWGQNNYKIQFRTDGQTFFTDIEEVDKSIGMIPLEEQSKGFQWFFSFDLHFMHDSDGTFEGCVLLLDEPGIHLHPGAQEDLLKRLDAYSEKNTTIYSTHLPFLVDLREPARIKVINQEAGSAVVSEDLGASQKEEKLTLQAALGMRAHQSYLVSENNLVVEGVDDYWTLTELSNVFERSEEEGIPENVMITAAGSASEIVHLATFMIGQDLHVVALFDSDDEGRRQEEKLRTKWLTRYKQTHSSTILLGESVGISDRDFMLEDIFPDEYYVEKVRESHAKKFTSIGKQTTDLRLSGSGPILPRIEQAFKDLNLQFNKGSAAKLIRKELLKTTSLNNLPEGTADNAKKLFSAIRTRFSNPKN